MPSASEMRSEIEAAREHVEKARDRADLDYSSKALTALSTRLASHVIELAARVEDLERKAFMPLSRTFPQRRIQQPEAGKQFVAIDVEGCATDNTEPGSMNPLDFKLQMPDNTRTGTTLNEGKQPALSSAQLVAGQCIRGWVTFEVPQGQKPARILREGFNSVVQWNVP